MRSDVASICIAILVVLTWQLPAAAVGFAAVNALVCAIFMLAGLSVFSYLFPSELSLKHFLGCLPLKVAGHVIGIAMNIGAILFVLKVINGNYWMILFFQVQNVMVTFYVIWLCDSETIATSQAFVNAFGYYWLLSGIVLFINAVYVGYSGRVSAINGDDFNYTKFFLADFASGLVWMFMAYCLGCLEAYTR